MQPLRRDLENRCAVRTFKTLTTSCVGVLGAIPKHSSVTQVGDTSVALANTAPQRNNGMEKAHTLARKQVLKACCKAGSARPETQARRSHLYLSLLRLHLCLLCLYLCLLRLYLPAQILHLSSVTSAVTSVTSATTCFMQAEQSVLGHAFDKSAQELVAQPTAPCHCPTSRPCCAAQTCAKNNSMYTGMRRHGACACIVMHCSLRALAADADPCMARQHVLLSHVLSTTLNC